MDTHFHVSSDVEPRGTPMKSGLGYAANGANSEQAEARKKNPSRTAAEADINRVSYLDLLSQPGETTN